MVIFINIARMEPNGRRAAYGRRVETAHPATEGCALGLPLPAQLLDPGPQPMLRRRTVAGVCVDDFADCPPAATARRARTASGCHLARCRRAAFDRVANRFGGDAEAQADIHQFKPSPPS